MKFQIRTWLFAVLTLMQFSCMPPRITIGEIPPAAKCIAVLPFEVRFDATMTSEVVSEFLALELEASGAHGVLGPIEASQLFKSAKDPLPPSIDSYWARETGKKIGVDAVIFGNVSQLPIMASPKGSPPTVLLNLEAYMIEVKTGVLNWTYVSKEEVWDDDLATRLSQHARGMSKSLLGENSKEVFSGTRNCWHNPPDLTPPVVETPVPSKSAKKKKPDPTPSPTPVPTLMPTPKPVGLSVKQKKMKEDLSKGEGIVFASTMFKERTTQLTKEGLVSLRNLIVVLRSADGPRKIQIAGHIDTTDDVAGDLTISKDRAEAVKTYLVNLGIDPSRMEAVGFGGNQPVVPNLNLRSRAMNQRIIVTSLDTHP